MTRSNKIVRIDLSDSAADCLAVRINKITQYIANALQMQNGDEVFQQSINIINSFYAPLLGTSLIRYYY